MTNFHTLQIPAPSNWQDFETLCCDLWRAIWKDPNTIKHGRQGQKQHGVDVSGRPNLHSAWAGVQCKGKDNFTDKELTEKEVRTEVEKAKSFEPKLSEFIIATTGPKDAKIEQVAREITDEHLNQGSFTIHIWGWKDIIERLADYPEVIIKYYPHLAANRLNESPPSLPPFILPQLDVSTFTGRTQELIKLESLLLKSGGERVCSIVGLAGTGGIGKSALACHFAELHKDAFPDGVIGIRVDGKDNDAIAREFARLCGEEIKPEDERAGSIIMQEVFGHRRMLLIFDNAEDPTIQSLRPGGNSCAIIITTRDRQLPFLLDVPVEGRIDLPPLPYSEATLLLEQLVGSERVTAEPKPIDEIIELVGSLPLALQIVGATLQMQAERSLENYATSLRAERERLEHLKVRGVSYLDVRASFSLSLKLLGDDEVEFFACLSVCAQDGFSMQAAIAAGGFGESTTHERLGYLYRLSLLNRPQSGAHRFVFHPLIRLFAQELSVERSLQDEAAERHARFFIQFVKSSDVNDRRVDSIMADELDDIILAAQWLQQREITDYSFVISLEPFLQRQGYWQQATHLMTGFLSLAEQKEDWNAVVQLRIQQAKYLSLRGDWAQAEETLLPVSETITRIEGQEYRRRCEAMWLNTLGGLRQRQGRFDEAAETFQRSAVIEEELGNLRGQAKVLNSLGSVLQRQGNFEAAANAFRRSAEIEGRIENRIGQAMVLNSLGSVLQRQGHFDEAVDSFKGSYDLLLKLGDRRGQAMVLNSLGGVIQRQGHFDEAVEAFQRSMAIEEQIGNKRGQAMVLNSLGGVLQRQGRFDEAVDVFRRSARIEEQIDNKRGQAMVLNSLGGVLQRQGRFDEAVDAFQRSYDLLLELEDQRGQAMVLNSLGGVLQRQGRFDEAVDAFQRSYAISEQLGDERSLAMVLNSLGGVLQRQGRFDEAVDVFKHSKQIGEGLGDNRHVAMALNSLGGVLQRQGRFDEAVGAFRRSYNISLEIKDKRGQAMVLNSLGGVLERKGNMVEALDAFNRSVKIGEELDDKRHLAMVHTSMGKSLLYRGELEKAAIELTKGFEFEESIKSQRGIGIVTPLLIQALTEMNRQDEALRYCQRALLIAPESTRLLGQKDLLSAPPEEGHKIILKQGSIKRIIRHAKGYRFGFIIPDDASVDVYFGERDVNPVSLPLIAEGTRVKFEVRKAIKGPQAKNVRIIEPKQDSM